ncbi:hypothetical protein C2845_PM03G29530 [Panicum miliaceum]|uniref:Uncharacterized protein n=1 Tax=Panicum miliaceum TaxID=4540 RepID=A0A3L6T842_PANMI|nr:hypothetical protein C2845_PM03G29530 [Panicum miliaceum]
MQGTRLRAAVAACYMREIGRDGLRSHGERWSPAADGVGGVWGLVWTQLTSVFSHQAVKLKMDLEKEHARGMQVLNKMNTRVRQLEAQVHEFQLQHMQQTQAEVFQVEDSIRELQQEINSANLKATRLSEEEKRLSEELQDIIKSISDIGKEIYEDDRRINQLKSQIEDLRRRQRDKLTAFGGDRVQSLYRSIERHHSRFECPPIGPIGYHVQLASDCWSLAVDCALGRLLDAFIVSCHKDSLVLRECAKEGHAERQVLVRDYEVGKSVAFDKRIRNLKEVYTSDGCKMFCRGSVETILPPNRKWRAGRLCTSLGEKIIEIENEAAEIKKINSERWDRKGKLVIDRDNINSELRILKRKREDEEQRLERKKVQLDDTKKISIANKHDTAMDTSELEAEMMQMKEDIGNKELVLEKINLKLTDALREENDKRASYKDFIESAHAEMGSINDVEHELQLVEEKIQDAQQAGKTWVGLWKYDHRRMSLPIDHLLVRTGPRPSAAPGLRLKPNANHLSNKNSYRNFGKID